MVIDTGTSLMTAPSEDLKVLLKYVDIDEKCSNYNKLPDITIVIQGDYYVLKKEDYVYAVYPNGSKERY